MYAGLISFAFSSATASGPVLLEHPLIHFVDKLMSSGAYGLVLQVRREVGKRLFGQPTKAGSKRGVYEYKGEKYTLVQLAKIEDAVEKEYVSKKNDLIEHKSNYGPAEWDAMMQELEDEYNHEAALLQEALKEAKEDFIEISKDYVEAARGTKEQVLVLIKESSDKRGLNDCFLLKWGEEEEGNETYYLRNDIHTLKDFAKFLYDLRNFLTDMANSMPRCKKKFMSLVRKSQQTV